MFNNKVNVEASCFAAKYTMAPAYATFQIKRHSESSQIGLETHHIHQVSHPDGLLQVSTRVTGAKDIDIKKEEGPTSQTAPGSDKKDMDFKRARIKNANYHCDKDCKCSLKDQNEKEQVGYGVDVDGVTPGVKGAVPVWLLIANDREMKMPVAKCKVDALKSGKAAPPLDKFPKEGDMYAGGAWIPWATKGTPITLN